MSFASIAKQQAFTIWLFIMLHGQDL
jgi:hypothetical protein